MRNILFSIFFVLSLVIPATAKPSDMEPRAYLGLVLNGGDSVAQPTATPQPAQPTATSVPAATSTPIPSAPTNTPVPPTATLMPTATPTNTPRPTATPARPVGVANCAAEPNAAQAPNSPVRISAIDKVAETVTLQNVSGAAVDIGGWRVCSITGNQLHATLSGVLSAGESRVIPSQAGTNIWLNSGRDDGALYDNNGGLVSYLVN